MIYSIQYAQGISSTRKTNRTVLQQQSAKEKSAVQYDRFEKSASKNKVKKQGTVKYTEPTKLLGIITIREGFYTYYPNNNETIGDIKRKFGIEDNVINEMNGIKNDDFCPAQNQIYEIYFRIKTKN